MAKALEDQVFPQLEERPAAAKDDTRFEPTQRRVRVMFAGVAIADSRKVMLMLENRRLAIYYFPVTDVRTDLFVPTTYSSNHPGKGDASFFSVKVGERVAPTRGRLRTCRSTPTGRSSRTSSGRTPRRSRSVRRSRTCSASTTRR